MIAASWTVLHAISGGIDSTSVLYQLMEAKERPLCYHIKLAGPRLKAESAAMTAILKWFADRYGYMVPCHFTSAQQHTGVYDIELAALVAGGLLRTHRNVTKTTVSTSLDDTLLPHWPKRNANRTQITEALAGRPLTWLRPNIDVRRADVIQTMPADLLALCSYCRRPRPDGGPCGKCNTCSMTP